MWHLKLHSVGQHPHIYSCVIITKPHHSMLNGYQIKYKEVNVCLWSKPPLQSNATHQAGQKKPKSRKNEVHKYNNTSVTSRPRNWSHYYVRQIKAKIDKKQIKLWKHAATPWCTSQPQYKVLGRDVEKWKNLGRWKPAYKLIALLS